MEELRNKGIFRAGSNQMRAVDGKQRIYLEWPKEGGRGRGGLK